MSTRSGFGVVTVVTSAIGHLMRRAGGSAAEDAVEGMRRVEGLAIVSIAWLMIAWFAGMPYMWNGLGQIDAMFEAMSGLTTTGATVFRDFSVYGRGVFFWRALTNWLGGMGVIALFVAILPRLAIGGREMFFAEASGPDEEKVAPQIRRTALLLWRLYAALTVLQIIALMLTGMPLFDSVCNTFATISAAGFSPHPLSIAGYQNPAGEWVMIVFMFLAGANFALQYRALAQRDWRIFTDDEELRAYAGVVALATLVLAFTIRGFVDEGEELRHAMFQVLSIITTTGFASVDFQLWNDQAKMVLLGLMFIGGCAGSAGGGPKVVRHVLLAQVHDPGTAAHTAPARHPAGEARRPRRAPDDPAGRDRVLPVLHADVRGVFRHRDSARRGYGHRHFGHGRHARQRRPGLQPGRPDGQFRRSASDQPGRVDAGDVDRPPRSDNGAGDPAARSVALRPVVRRPGRRRLARIPLPKREPASLSAR